MGNGRHRSLEARQLRAENSVGGAKVATGPASGAESECASDMADIGRTAGEIWHCLQDHGNGHTSTAWVARQGGCGPRQFERAIGWLAREDKVCFERSGEGEIIRLK